MITIVRYRNDTYYGVAQYTDIPLRVYSGYTHEDRQLELFYRQEFVAHRKILESLVYLNKVLVKEALDKEINEWSRMIYYERYRQYSIYHLNQVTIEELTQQTPEHLLRQKVV